MEGAGGVEDVGAGAGGVQSPGDFLTDVSGLAGAGDTDAADAVSDKVNRPEERFAEASRDFLQSRGFATDDLARVVKSIGGLADGQEIVDLQHGQLPCVPGGNSGAP